MTIDYRTLLGKHGEERWATTFLYDAAHTILAARIPDLCPDCKGDPRVRIDVGYEHGESVPCDHPNAPTIAKVLAVGHVMLEANGDMSRFADPELLPADHVKAINSMLAYIIEVDPSRLAALRTEADR